MTQLLNSNGLSTSAGQLQMLNDPTSVHRPFDEALDGVGLHPLRATGIEIFQINVGKL